MALNFKMIVSVFMATVLSALSYAPLVPSALAAEQGNQVGVEQASIPDPDHAPISAIVWYPTKAEARDVQVGPIAIKAAPGAPIAGPALPMVLVSHGTGAGETSHIDTAMALARAGYIVVTPTHTGDNFQDDSIVGRAAWFADRSRHIVRTIEFMRGDWRGAQSVDQGRIGIFGFSAGATTTLIAIGGEPDLGRLAPHCAKQPEFVCQLFRTAEAQVTTPAWSHDPRIAAAAIAAPGLGFLFGPGSLAKVKAPVQLWAGGNDEIVPFASNTANVRQLLPTTPEFHMVEGASHLSFLAPCPDPSIFPAICTDRPGFDRSAFHDNLNSALIAFFNRSLTALK
ncbi:MAG: dienelactone hydrolase family protein [Sphingorhabdus sp.]